MPEKIFHQCDRCTAAFQGPHDVCPACKKGKLVETPESKLKVYKRGKPKGEAKSE